ncbi:MAG: DedA family protein [Gammaproteobacteria bacterium]
MSEFAQLLTAAEPWLRHYGYVALGVAAGMEGFGVPMPGETLLIGAALLADRGDLFIGSVVAVAWLAAFSGDNLGYLVGRYGGHRLLREMGVSAQRLDRLRRFLVRYGPAVLLLGRFFDGTRQLDGLIAGSVRMPWWRFALFDGLGVAAWVSVWGYGVYALEAHAAVLHRLIREVNHPLAMLILAVFAGSVGYLLYEALGRWRREIES